VAPAEVVLSAAYPSESGAGVVARVLNASGRAVEASLRPAVPPGEALAVDPLERPLRALALSDGLLRLPLGPWQVATILLKP
jgi:hypothetical protein